MQIKNKIWEGITLPISLFILLYINFGCKKFLDETPNSNLVIPTTVQHVQALMDQYPTINSNFPNMIAESDDDFYVKDIYYNTLSNEMQKNLRRGKRCLK